MAIYGYVWLCWAVNGYVWLSRAMKYYVRLYTLLLVTNGEPLYDAYTTYLPAKINPSNPSGGAAVSLKS